MVDNKKTEPFDVYIGRPSPWGNPWVIGKDGTRDFVIDTYKMYFDQRIANDYYFRRDILKLKNKRLGCFCKPFRCHGDIIVDYLNNL